MAFGYSVLLFCAVIVAVSSAGIIETLLSWNLPSTEGRSSTTPQSKCLCQTSGCLCCVELNLTSTIELGGPACINIKQKEENIFLNMSYGETSHTASIKTADVGNTTICMNLLSELAQLCTNFKSVKQSDHGTDGCIVLEPALLKSSQATYRMGCFNFHQDVRQIEPSLIAENADAAFEDEADDELDTDALIAAVSEGAQQSIVFLTQWLGLNLDFKPNISDNSTKVDQTSTTTNTTTSSRSRKSLMTAEENKKEENFKQLLSAQDNIFKEPTDITNNNGGLQTTFVYPKSVEQQSSSNSTRVPATVVPRESRRGGRAYNIHQHVNEI